MIHELRTLNDIILKKDNISEKTRKKQLLIKDILKDDNCFMNMSIDTAFNILNDLCIPKEKIKETYNKLINFNNYE